MLQAEDVTSAEVAAFMAKVALGRFFATRTEGREALRDAVLAGTIDRAVAISLVHARVVRENALMADAMGSLATTHFAPLE